MNLALVTSIFFIIAMIGGYEYSNRDQVVAHGPCTIQVVDQFKLMVCNYEGLRFMGSTMPGVWGKVPTEKELKQQETMAQAQQKHEEEMRQLILERQKKRLKSQ